MDGWVVGSQGYFGSKEQPAPLPHVIRKGAGDDCDLGALQTSLTSGPHEGWDCGFSPCLEQRLVWSLLLFGAFTHSSPAWLGFPPRGPAVVLSATLAPSFLKFLSSDWLCACLHLSIASVCRKIDCEQ